jgi:hypothetical protein
LNYIRTKQQQGEQHQKKRLALDSTEDDDSSESQIATGGQTVF